MLENMLNYVFLGTFIHSFLISGSFCSTCYCYSYLVISNCKISRIYAHHQYLSLSQMIKFEDILPKHLVFVAYVKNPSKGPVLVILYSSLQHLFHWKLMVCQQWPDFAFLELVSSSLLAHWLNVEQTNPANPSACWHWWSIYQTTVYFQILYALVPLTCIQH